jgi:hypothetical protein
LPVGLVSWRSSRLINLQLKRPEKKKLKKKTSPFIPVPTVVLTGPCRAAPSFKAGSFCNARTRRHPFPAKSHRTDALMPKDVGRATDLIRAEVHYGAGGLVRDKWL